MVLAQILIVPFAVISLILLRRDRFRRAVQTITVGLILILIVGLVPLGFSTGAPLFMLFLMPITLTGLLSPRRDLLLISGLSIGVVAAIPMLEQTTPPLAGFAPLTGDMTIPLVGTFFLLVGMLSLLLDRFGGALRVALQTALTREQMLDQLRASLESTVVERTAALRDALKDVEQRETQLAHTLTNLRASQDTIQELSAPVIPVLTGVLVAPLVGALDSARAATFTANLLSAVERLRTRHVIFDITGVPVVDTQVAQTLIRTADATQLLGAGVLLVGIRPEVAQTMVALNISLGAIATYPDLQKAVESLLQRNGWRRTDPHRPIT
jgi:anti-anti-sigma regulatory factor